MSDVTSQYQEVKMEMNQLNAIGRLFPEDESVLSIDNILTAKEKALRAELRTAGIPSWSIQLDNTVWYQTASEIEAAKARLVELSQKYL